MGSLSLLAASPAFAPVPMHVVPSLPSVARTGVVHASVFDSATSQFSAEFPWFAMLGTGYAKSHGFFPEGAIAPLTYADWGGLAQMGNNEYISNERAIIMIAHIHALAISFAAAF